MKQRIFLKLLFLVIPFVAGAQHDAKPSHLQYLLVGTYTSGKSEGIYIYKFNSNTGAFEYVNKATGIRNPSYLATSPDNKKVYAVNELHDNNNGGYVTAFSFDSKSAAMTRLNDQPSGGDDPCYVSIDKTGHWAIVANYSSGSFSVLPIRTDGSLGKPNTIFHHGIGFNKERQAGPHVHSTVLSPDNHYLYVSDLGLDKVMIYHFDEATGELKPTIPGFGATEPGSGPRHFIFHPSGKFAYLIEEMAGVVTAFRYDQKGQLKTIQTISSHPKGFKGDKGSADIHISPDGKFLYASNRGDANSLAIFSINTASGLLKTLGFQSTLGKNPRNFSLDPSGKFLLVANQGSDNIVIFKRDPKTGKLVSTGKTIQVPTPVCIKWIPVPAN